MRARALVEGRLAPSVDDVAALAIPVLKHRVALTFAARADGETVEGLIGKLVERLGKPMLRTRVLGPSERRPSRPVLTDALDLAARLPRLILEARRVSASIHGIHGRRRAGPGETFWQYRPLVAGESASRIDWRRSARDGHLFVREREWEASHSIWLWIDRSPSMGFASSLAMASKLDRALVAGFALAETMVEGGERVGHLGLTAGAGFPSHRRAAGTGRHRGRAQHPL